MRLVHWFVDGNRFASSCCRVFFCGQSAMSPAQKEAYEENKLKMRKAIADPALVDESELVRKYSRHSLKISRASTDDERRCCNIPHVSYGAHRTRKADLVASCPGLCN